MRSRLIVISAVAVLCVVVLMMVRSRSRSGPEGPLIWRVRSTEADSAYSIVELIIPPNSGPPRKHLVS
jgi:hypothetical protein